MTNTTPLTEAQREVLDQVEQRLKQYTNAQRSAQLTPQLLESYAEGLYYGRPMTGVQFSAADASKLRERVVRMLVTLGLPTPRTATAPVTPAPGAYPGASYIDEGAEREAIVLGALYDCLGRLSTLSPSALLVDETEEQLSGIALPAFDGAKFVEQFAAWWQERTGRELRTSRDALIDGWVPAMGMPVEKRALAGLYGKYVVSRVDGEDRKGAKHDGCALFVLDLTHDSAARIAALEYAERVRATLPALARDLVRICNEATRRAVATRDAAQSIAQRGVRDPYEDPARVGRGGGTASHRDAENAAPVVERRKEGGV